MKYFFHSDDDQTLAANTMPANTIAATNSDVSLGSESVASISFHADTADVPDPEPDHTSSLATCSQDSAMLTISPAQDSCEPVTDNVISESLTRVIIISAPPADTPRDMPR